MTFAVTARVAPTRRPCGGTAALSSTERVGGCAREAEIVPKRSVFAADWSTTVTVPVNDAPSGESVTSKTSVKPGRTMSIVARPPFATPVSGPLSPLDALVSVPVSEEPDWTMASEPLVGGSDAHAGNGHWICDVQCPAQVGRRRRGRPPKSAPPSTQSARASQRRRRAPAPTDSPVRAGALSTGPRDARSLV